MKLTYDPRYNIAYICLKEKTSQVETICVSEEMNVDIAPDGTIYGIELLNAKSAFSSRSQRFADCRELALGESSEIKLTL